MADHAECINREERSELFRSLGRLEANTAALLEQVGGLKDSVTSQDTRISRLERWRSTLAGAWLVVATLLAYLANRLGDALFHRNS